MCAHQKKRVLPPASDAATFKDYKLVKILKIYIHTQNDIIHMETQMFLAS